MHGGLGVTFGVILRLQVVWAVFGCGRGEKSLSPQGLTE